MSVESADAEPQPDLQALLRSISPYGQPNIGKAVWQMINTFLPYFALWALMIYFVKYEYPWWIILVTMLPASALAIRIFILFHDCCHGSFFKSKTANRILGYIAGVLTFAPYEEWQGSHLEHHATAGNLDRRGTGDIWTMTVKEYQAASLSKRITYRIIRNPFMMLIPGPILIFFIIQRFSRRGSSLKEKASVIITDFLLLGIIVGAIYTIGLKTYLLIQIPVMFLAGSAGIWLFYVQHQFETVYWTRQDNWKPLHAALDGSSYYKLPKILQWFTGNIGLHHIHHIYPRIPNYNLQRCYDNTPVLQNVKPMTFRSSLKSAMLNLYDEEGGRMLSFKALGKMTTNP